MTKRREMTQEDAVALLAQSDYGVLSTVSAENEPYGIPLNYCYRQEENCLIFHCAVAGRKLENILAHPQVSFAVVGQQRVVPERFVTHYESVIVTGIAEIVKDEEEKIARLWQLCEKYSPGEPRAQELISSSVSRVAIVKVHISAITGKRNRDD